MLEVASLHVHPVKGCGAIDVEQLVLDVDGPRFDREWMLVGDDDVFVTQRQLPRMALVGVRIDEPAGTLRLSFPDSDDLEVPLAHTGPARRAVRCWLDTIDALDEGDAAARWASERLGRSLRLVRMAPDARRPVPPMFTPVEATTRFTDAFPLLVVAQASLSALERRLGRALAMRRFRPNVVVAGAAPHAEDGWKRVRVGEGDAAVVLAFGKLCSRCQVPTVDPSSGERSRDGEPLSTLATYRTRELDHGGGHVERGVFFGANYVHEGPGTIRVGDPVEVVD